VFKYRVITISTNLHKVTVVLGVNNTAENSIKKYEHNYEKKHKDN